MSSILREASATIRTEVIGAYIFGVILVGAGVWLVYLGATGDTQISFFGQTFKSTNVGIAALFLGAASIVLLLRRSLTSLDRAVQTEAPEQPRPNEWPNTKSLDALGRKLRSLSENQWTILYEIEKADGLHYIELMRRSDIGVGPSELQYRLEVLEAARPHRPPDPLGQTNI